MSQQQQRIFVYGSSTPPAELEQHRLVGGIKDLAPGDLLVYDFRAPISSNSDGQDDFDTKKSDDDDSSLNVVQWNIERGMALDGIITELSTNLNGDVLMLEELDISCQRSNFKNTPLELAQRLQMLCIFVCEFHELASTTDCVRSAENEVGCLYAYHGNAIMTRRQHLHSIRAFPHSTTIDWERRVGFERKEPRRGTRYMLTACLDVPRKERGHGAIQRESSSAAITSSSFGRIQLYALHLEIFCGPLARLRQYADAVYDAKMQRRRFFGLDTSPYHEQHPLRAPVPSQFSPTGSSVPLLRVSNDSISYLALPPPPTPSSTFSVIIGGDLNTVMHSIVRFSSLYAEDRLRWMSLGETEAQWLQRNALDLSNASVPFDTSRAHQAELHRKRYLGTTSTTQRLCSWLDCFIWRRAYSVPQIDQDRFDNAELKLFDDYDKYYDVTLNSPKYKGFVQGKLDWLLLSNLRVISKGIGNHDYSLSDHKSLWNRVLISFPPNITTKDESLQRADEAVAVAHVPDKWAGGVGYLCLVLERSVVVYVVYCLLRSAIQFAL